jgi:SAM-dependent methyltransferase
VATNLADKQFWENDFYWARSSVPCRPDLDMPFDRAVAAELGEFAPVEHGQSVIEIGCAPAKWLVFYAERFGARVSGVEYTGKGAALSRANLESVGIEATIHEADFFALPPEPHDLVLSLGFIEHFDDLDATFDRHLEFVRRGGRLALGVPNFHGLNRAAQQLADPAYLRLHNLAAMRPELYRRWAATRGLELQHLAYFGGFDPALISPAADRAAAARIAAKTAILAGLAYRRLPISDRLQHPLFSSYLLGVFRRPG